MSKKKEKISEEEEAMPLPAAKLPEDIVEDILSRLPVKSLPRFRCVSKSWCALITDPSFVKMHLNRSIENDTNRKLILMVGHGSSFYSVDLDACEKQAAVELDLPARKPLKSSLDGTKVGGSCNGLLCVYNSWKDVFLWNPATGRHRKLPVSPIESPGVDDMFLIFGLGYDPTSEDYKLVRIAPFSEESGDRNLPSEMKVYSLSSNSWRKISYMSKPFKINAFHGFGVFANSALHWVGFRETQPDQYSSFIVSIDLKDEEYRELPLPDSLLTPLTYVGVRGGQLFLLCDFRGDIEVWAMKDYGIRDSWVKEFSIKQSVIRDFRVKNLSIRHGYFGDFTPACYSKNGVKNLSIQHWNLDDITPVCYSKNGEFVLEIDFKALFLYDPSRGSDKNLWIGGIPDRRIETKICVESLVSLDAKDGTEQAETKKKNRK